MKCPNCGSKVFGKPFCPNCGADLTQVIRRKRRILRNLDRGMRHGLSAAIVLVTIVAVSLVLLSGLPGDGGNRPSVEIPDGALVLSDGSYIVLDGDFGTSMSASTSRGGHVNISLDGGRIEGCSSFLWVLTDLANSSSQFITKDRPELTWDKPEIGTFSLSVYCYDGVHSEPKVSFTGGMECYGDREIRFSWAHSGKNLNMSYTIQLSDYLEVAGYTGIRNDPGIKAGISFVDTGAMMRDIESRAWSAYSASFDGSRTSADYATFLFEMVNSVIVEGEDYRLYGASTYWAYPIETLYKGAGDSGDVSILMISLLNVAGFDTALAKLPGMWSPMVRILGFQPTPMEGCNTLSYTIGGVQYWMSKPIGFSGLGNVPDCYSYNRGYLYYGKTVSDGFSALEC